MVIPKNGESQVAVIDADRLDDHHRLWSSALAPRER